MTTTTNGRIGMLELPVVFSFLSVDGSFLRYKGRGQFRSGQTDSIPMKGLFSPYMGVAKERSVVFRSRRCWLG